MWSSGLRAAAASMTPGRLSLLRMGFGIGVYGDVASGALFVRVGFCLRCSFSDGVCFLAGGGVLSAVAARVHLTDRSPVIAGLRFRFTGSVAPVTGRNRSNSNLN